MVRVGSVSSPVSVARFVITNGLLHPHGQASMDSRTSVREFAASDGRVAVHHGAQGDAAAMRRDSRIAVAARVAIAGR